MSIEVISTRRAQQPAENLDRAHALVFTAFVDDLARNGCAALGNRLTGPLPVADLISRAAKQRRPRRLKARVR